MSKGARVKPVARHPVRAAVLSPLVRALVGAGVVAPGLPAGTLRWADALNAMPRVLQTVVSTRWNITWRRRVLIGSGDVDGIVISPMNFALNPTAIGLPGNAVTIVKMALERASPASVAPVTWGGARSITLADGESDAQRSDKLLPSAFGLTKFTRGELYYLRGQISVAADGQKYPASGIQSFQTPTEIAISWGAGATVSDVDTTGNISYSGSNYGSVPMPYGFHVLGSFVSGDPATFSGIGDSIAFGQNNGTRTGYDGTAGLFIKSLLDTDGMSNPLAGCQMAVAGGQYTPWVSDANKAKLTAYLKYGKYIVDEMGTNDINVGAATASSVFGLAQTLYAQVRADYPLHVSKVLRTELLCYTTSVVAGDTANQVKNSKWQAGAAVESLNALWGTTGGADVVIPTHAAIAQAGDPWLWTTSYIYEAGSPYTYLHPNAAGYNALAAAIRPVLLAQG